MKTIMILGGTKGVGRLLVQSCYDKGYNIAFCGRNEEEGHAVISKFPEKNRVLFFTINYHDSKSVNSYFKKTIKTFGKINGLVIYSGISPIASLIETDENLIDEVFHINLKYPLLLVSKVLNQMIIQKEGSLIFFGSPHMDYGDKDRAVYALSKGALYHLSNHIAHHYAIDNIRSNYIVMGWTKTEGELNLRKSQGITEKQLEDMASSIIPMGKMLNPNDIIPAVIHLLEDESKMTTGSVIRITGGHYI